MKLILLFFFSITTPFFIFLTEVLYGGTSPTDLKNGLSESSVYKDISDVLINTKPEGDQDAVSSDISTLIYNRFTPEYVQNKTEKLIDDSHIWITRDGPAPVLSFGDIREDLLATNPEFQTQFEQIALASKQQSKNEVTAEESLNEYAGDPEAQNELSSITALTQNDFTVPVGDYFIGIKNFFYVMKILQPILAVLLLTSLVFQLTINHTLSSRLRWIGATFITTAVFGFGMVIFNSLAIQHLVEVTVSNTENFLAAFAPIILQIMNIFMNLYGGFQNYVSIYMLIAGILCCVVSYIIKPRLALMPKSGKK